MPIEKDAFYAMLGIAMRAGALALGESGVSKAIQTGAARFVLVDADASDNTKKKFRDSCAFYHVELFEAQAGRLGQAVGRPGRMSAAVAGGTLGEKLLALAREGEG
ncbi:MAG TPA: ribosomal L7Ae/L30e/S12e/Gadd45 family protein [Candidatus Ventricola intestinavium]|nr:ribosomal L7Ae/L30e/S12e/Gadd45 family protein [Candidatus Ventricola intestinavium]